MPQLCHVKSWDGNKEPPLLAVPGVIRQRSTLCDSCTGFLELKIIASFYTENYIMTSQKLIIEKWWKAFIFNVIVWHFFSRHTSATQSLWVCAAIFTMCSCLSHPCRSRSNKKVICRRGSFPIRSDISYVMPWKHPLPLCKSLPG